MKAVVVEYLVVLLKFYFVPYFGLACDHKISFFALSKKKEKVLRLLEMFLMSNLYIHISTDEHVSVCYYVLYTKAHSVLWYFLCTV